MNHRPPKRTYAIAALRDWLLRLTSDWERFFDKTILEKGRGLYKTASIKALDIQKDALTAQATTADRKAPAKYVIVEAKPTSGFSIRASWQDDEEAQALAVAGLYELEEFLSEEEERLHHEDDDAPSEKNLILAKASPRDDLKTKSLPPPRRMELLIEADARGLCFSTRWLLTKKPVEQALVHPAEREAWIRLSHWARKEGFVYQPASKHYYLSDLSEGAIFLNTVLPGWLRFYSATLSPTAQSLKKGKQKATLEVLATKAPSGIALKPTIRLGEASIAWADVRHAFKHKTEAIIKGYGWVNISEADRLVIDDIQTHFKEDACPEYMRYCLYVKQNNPLLTAPALAGEKPPLALKLPSCLRPYQAEGVRWMAELFSREGHGLLADEMGLGKTLQVLSLLNARPSAELPSIVVCPASVVSVWEMEAKKFFPDFTVCVLSKKDSFSKKEKPSLWISSYTQLRRHRHLLSEQKFAYAILDEAQTIKNPHSKTAQAACAIEAKWRLALSGTPIENTHLDIWSVFRFLMPGLLGSKRFFEQALSKPGATQQLKVQLKPFILRRVKEDVLKELPEKTVMVLDCPLTDPQKAAYKHWAQAACQELNDGFGEDGQGRMHVFSLLTRLRQAAIDPALLPENEALPHEASGKLMVLLERVTELIDNKEKVVIFSQFVRLLKRVEKLLHSSIADLSIFKILGETKDRGEVIEHFQSLNKPAVMLASLKAAGAGITLHAASYVFIMDPWWNPAVEAQAIDRVHRLGQKKPVFVYRLIAPGTLEEKIENLKIYKKGIFDDLVGDMPPIAALQTHFKTLGDLVNLQHTES